jgi:hypothetical protein
MTLDLIEFVADVIRRQKLIEDVSSLHPLRWKEVIVVVKGSDCINVSDLLT